MSKNIDYPKASFKNSLEIAETTHELGDCKIETCAEKLGKKKSGGFNDLVSGAIKYGLIERKNGILSTTDLYNSIETSYDDEEKNNHLVKAFLSPVLFRLIYEKYKDTKLPTDILDKIIIREFKESNVNQKNAGQVSGYFKAGAKFTKLLNEDNTFNKINSDNKSVQECIKKSDNDTEQENKGKVNQQQTSLDYFVDITGPENFNFSTILKSDGDIEVLNSIIGSVKSKINNKTEDENSKSVTKSDD